MSFLVLNITASSFTASLSAITLFLIPSIASVSEPIDLNCSAILAPDAEVVLIKAAKPSSNLFVAAVIAENLSRTAPKISTSKIVPTNCATAIIPKIAFTAFPKILNATPKPLTPVCSSSVVLAKPLEALLELFIASVLISISLFKYLLRGAPSAKRSLFLSKTALFALRALVLFNVPSLCAATALLSSAVFSAVSPAIRGLKEPCLCWPSFVL